MKKNKKTLARESTLQILYKQEFNETPSLIKDSSSELNQETQNYVNHLLKGIKQNKTKIDDLIQKTSKYWSFKRISLIDRNIMRIAIYEMLYSIPPIPFKVCINESIEIAKKYGTENSPIFINGNLDTISKLKKNV